jgi:hypothetical protein
MDSLQFLNHLLNFFAPALCIALLVPLGARTLLKKVPSTPVLYRQIAVNFILCGTGLGLSLLFFGRDGKMATYAVMTLLCASSQWLMLRGWRA